LGLNLIDTFELYFYMAKLYLIVLVSMGFAVNVFAAGSDVEEPILNLRFAYGEVDSNGEPPYYYLTKENEFVGVALELLTQALEPLRVEFTPVFAPRKHLKDLFKVDEVDVDVMNEQWVPRHLPVAFSNSIYVDSHYIFTNIDRVNDFPTFETLKGKRQCAHSGYVYSKVQLLTDTKQMLRIDANTDEQMLKMLVARRCDILVGPLRVTTRTIDSIGLNDHIAKTNLVDHHWDVQFMLNGKYSALIPRINRFLARSDYPEIRDRIIKRYADLAPGEKPVTQ